MIKPKRKKTGKKEEGESFPYPYLAAVMSFSLVLLLDKVALNTHSEIHSHNSHGRRDSDPRLTGDFAIDSLEQNRNFFNDDPTTNSEVQEDAIREIVGRSHYVLRI